VPSVVEADNTMGGPIPLSPFDELEFIRECAARLNAFIRTYPKEAHRVLAAFLPYEHELAELHEAFDPSRPPGVSVAALFAGIFQTQHGQGWVLSPVFGRDPELGTIVLRLDVTRQTPSGDTSH
jgi:hypothetical protein